MKAYTINTGVSELTTISTVDEVKTNVTSLTELVKENEKVIISLVDRYEHFLDIYTKHEKLFLKYQDSQHMMNTNLINSLTELAEITSKTDKTLFEYQTNSNKKNENKFKKLWWAIGFLGTGTLVNLILQIIQLIG